MAETRSFEAGNYRYIRGPFQYSAGVAADPGYAIVRMRFRRPVSLADGFAVIEESLGAHDRPLTAFCACELRSPAPFTEQGFIDFNRAYVGTLEKWGIYEDEENPVARSNVCPADNPPSEPGFHAFSFTVPVESQRPSFIIAGSAEAAEGPGSYAERIIRPGETSADAMAEKARFVLSTLEARMRDLAETDGDIYLPNPEPSGPVEYVLICMEPSRGSWARTEEEARSRIEAGFRNFLSSIEDFILHFCIRQYLCKPAEGYHITDLSKGAMLVKQAGVARAQRYDRWYALLEEELNLVATPTTRIFAVGKSVADHLERRAFDRPFAGLIHYSGRAAGARNAGISGHLDRFEAFRSTVSLERILATAEEVLTASAAPTELRDETLARLARSQLSTSRKKLIFNYKLVFETMGS